MSPSAVPQQPARCQTTVRVAAASFALPFHDHRGAGVNLEAMREVLGRLAPYRPNFICFPEGCASLANRERAQECAPEMAPYAAAVGRLAREFDTALIIPCYERCGDRVYNAVPIVNRQGELVLVYRKNYPTIGELESGISPGTDVPVAECDGVRVGAAVCFDLNFDCLAAALERNRARLVFWPSMYWGGQILQHWALRYGFALVAVYSLESTIVDMNGRILARQGEDTYRVRSGLLPAWALADIALNRELYHLDYNMAHFPEILERYGPEVDLEVWEPEGYFLLASRREDLPVEAIAAEFGLETLRDYLARSVNLRNEHLHRQGE